MGSIGIQINEIIDDVDPGSGEAERRQRQHAVDEHARRGRRLRKGKWHQDEQVLDPLLHPQDTAEVGEGGAGRGDEPRSGAEFFDRVAQPR